MHCVALSDDDDDVIVSVCCHGPTRERDLKERKGGMMAVRPSSVKHIGCLMEHAWKNRMRRAEAELPAYIEVAMNSR